MLVADTSAVIDVLGARAPATGLVKRFEAEADLHAPHLIDVEVLHVLRGFVRAGGLSADRAHEARRDFDDLMIVRYPHGPLADRAWELRDNLSAYDAMFVALAEALGATLVTCDRRLAHAARVTAEVELYG